MEIAVDFDDGSRIRRRWFLKGDSVRSEKELPPWLGDKPDESILAMLDAGTYFNKTERERVAYVAANVPGGSARTQQDVLLAACEAAGRPSSVGTPLVDAVLDAVAVQVDVERGRALTIQEWIEAAVAGASAFKNGSAARAKIMEDTARGLSALRTQDAPTANPETLDKKRLEVAAEIERLQNEKAGRMAAFEAAKTNRGRREVLQLEVRGKTGLETRREGLEHRIDAKEHDLAGIPQHSDEDVTRMTQEERDSAVALAGLSQEIRQVDESVGRLEREREDMAAKTTCPYCGASGEGWKALKTAELTSALAGLRAKLDDLRNRRGAESVRGSNLSQRLSAARAASASAAYAHRDLTGLRTELDGVLNGLNTITLRERELAEIPAEDPALTAAVETAQSAINVKNQELREIDEKHRLLMGRLHDLKRLADAETARDESKKDAEAGGKAADKLREIQSEIVAEIFCPLLETANRLFGSVLTTLIAYNAEAAEIGTWRGGVWVAHKTFSGNEQLLTYAAIQAALASRCKVRLMLLDELGRIADDKLPQILESVNRALRDGAVDQFFGIDVRERGFGAFFPGEQKICQVIPVA